MDNRQKYWSYQNIANLLAKRLASSTVKIDLLAIKILMEQLELIMHELLIQGATIGLGSSIGDIEVSYRVPRNKSRGPIMKGRFTPNYFLLEKAKANAFSSPEVRDQIGLPQYLMENSCND